MAVQTDRYISVNRPDIIIKDKVNMTVSCDKNVSSKEIEKKSKYKELEVRYKGCGKSKQR